MSCRFPSLAGIAIFASFYFDIPQTSALSPQSYLFNRHLTPHKKMEHQRDV
jgi:hypothetical protein